MSDRRYIDHVGGKTNGRIERDQHAGARLRHGERELDGCSGDASDISKGSKYDGIRSDIRISGRSGQRKFDGWFGGASPEHIRRAAGQGIAAPGGDRKRDLLGVVGGRGEQDRRQPFALTDKEPDGFDPGTELVRLIARASSALARLDADELEEVGRHAEAFAETHSLATALHAAARNPSLKAEVWAFSRLLQATLENLATLRRAENAAASQALSANQFGDASYDGYRATAQGLFERFGLYNERDEGTSIWPRAGVDARGAKHP